MVASSHLGILRSRERCLRGRRRCSYLCFAPRPRLRCCLCLRLYLPPSLPPLPGPRSGRGAATQTLSHGRRDPHGKMAAEAPDGRAERLRGAPGWAAARRSEVGGQCPPGCPAQAIRSRRRERGSGRSVLPSTARPRSGRSGGRAVSRGAAGTGIVTAKGSHVSAIIGAVKGTAEGEDAATAFKVLPVHCVTAESCRTTSP